MQSTTAKWCSRLVDSGAYNNLPKPRIQTFAKLLSNLRRVSDYPSDFTYSACCPAHADSKPSLSVTLATDGRILMNCHRDCEFDEIVECAGMSMAEMFPGKSAAAVRPAASPKLLEPKATVADKTWETVHRKCQESSTAAHLEELAEDLQLDVDALSALEVGWSESDCSWTFPERNAYASVCGVLRRYVNGTKRLMRKGKRGLYLPHGWDSSDNSLLICEGPTDTLAAITSGCRAIGRPGVSSGFNDLAILLEHVEQKTIVVADNDSHGAGQKGAEKLAKNLGEYLKREVYQWSPPTEFKDIREYVNGGIRNGVKSK